MYKTENILSKSLLQRVKLSQSKEEMTPGPVALEDDMVARINII